MEELIESIYSNPQDWYVCYMGFKHEPSNLVFCVDWGLTSCRYSDLYISWWQGYRLRKAYRWWCKNAPISSLKGDTGGRFK